MLLPGTDVISETSRATGFATGLFDASETNAKEIKDKDAKIVYLTKIIDCVGFATGSLVAVNPKKIVAGHEPENTNALFQQVSTRALLLLFVASHAVAVLRWCALWPFLS